MRSAMICDLNFDRIRKSKKEQPSTEIKHASFEKKRLTQNYFEREVFHGKYMTGYINRIADIETGYFGLIILRHSSIYVLNEVICIFCTGWMSFMYQGGVFDPKK